MKHRIIGILIAVASMAATNLFGSLGVRAAPAAAPKGTGEHIVVVEHVLDGDTVVIRGWKQRVRLANIDAPEMSHGHGKPGQPYSVQATRWLTDRVQLQVGVTIRCVDEDRYQRPVCNLYKGGTHVNKELVLAGLAWANTANPRYLRDRNVLNAQLEARDARRGLWGEPGATEPWRWRHECWERKACKPSIQ